jgi:hypothetical protein
MTFSFQAGAPERNLVSSLATSALAERSARSTSAIKSLIKVPLYIVVIHSTLALTGGRLNRGHPPGTGGNLDRECFQSGPVLDDKRGPIKADQMLSLQVAEQPGYRFP